jgi:pectinesterase inhibitor-like protein
MAARLLLPLVLVLLVGSQAALASSVVEETCANATEGSNRKDLDGFCVTTLQAAPGSATADARGLAFIATNLTLANYTAAVATIKGLQRRGGWSDGQLAALATCRRRYIEALNVVHSAVHALATRRKQAYVADMGAVRRAAVDCDDAFANARGAPAAADKEDQSPLRKVNGDAEDLTTVAMLIVILL